MRQVEGCRLGEPEFDDPWMLLVSSTVADPDRAPGATFKILTAAPADLAGGRSWEDLGPQYGQHLLSLAARHVQGLDSDNIAAVRYETPTSLAARSPSNIGGSCHGGEFATAEGDVVPGLQRWASTLDGLVLHRFDGAPGRIGLGMARQECGSRGVVRGGYRSPEGDELSSDSAMITIRLGSFSNSFVDAVARRAGMYRDERLQVEFCRVFNSPSQFEKLVLGEVDVVLTATDNVLNYRYRRRSDNNSPLDVRIVRAVELGGGVSLVAARVTSLHDLRGALIAVDDTDSGFALLLYELLARAGMVRGQDYRVVAFGVTPRRFEGLVHGDFDATMFNAGFDLRAADRGCSRSPDGFGCAA